MQSNERKHDLVWRSILIFVIVALVWLLSVTVLSANEKSLASANPALARNATTATALPKRLSVTVTPLAPCDQPVCVDPSSDPSNEPVENVPMMPNTDLLLFDFAQPANVNAWGVINDGVMGGVSRSSIRQTAERTLLFAGTVSLENNGGFASSRASFSGINLSAYEGLAIHLKGDGKRYGFYFQNNQRRLNYQSDFTTVAGQWQVVRIRFDGVTALSFGRRVQAPPLDLTDLRVFSFIISDKQEGPFALEVATISAYK